MISSQDKAYQRYLLGVANEEEESRVEEAVLGGEIDASFLAVAEDQLIDDYLFGSLDQEEKRGFEERFLLIGDRRQRLSFASGLVEHCRRVPLEESSSKPKAVPQSRFAIVWTWKHAAFLGMAASILLAALLGLEVLRHRDQMQIAQQAQSMQMMLQSTSSAGHRDTDQAQITSTGYLSGEEFAKEQIPSLELGSLSRGSHETLFRIPAQTRWVRINWEIPIPPSGPYRVVLLSAQGRQLWAEEVDAEVSPPATPSIAFLPASILTPGSFHLQVSEGSQGGKSRDLADFVFRVVR